jgi:hypothetical protein
VNPWLPTHGVAFESVLVSDLMAERHWSLVARGIRPIRFMWSTHPRMGWKNAFHVQYPDGTWHCKAFNKAVDGWVLTDATLDEMLRDEFRQVITPYTSAYKAKHPYCERPGCPNPRDGRLMDVDHVDPEFLAIATAAIALMSAKEREEIVRTAAFSDDLLRLSKPVLDYLRDVHKTAKLMTVHPPDGWKSGCHTLNARDRRGGDALCLTKRTT